MSTVPSRMKRVYVAHPLRGGRADMDIVMANIARVSEIMRKLAAEEPEVLFFSPVHAFGFMDPLGPEEWVMKQCLEMLALCDELWVYGPWRESKGCNMEIKRAIFLKKPIVYKEKIYNIRQPTVMKIMLDKEDIEHIEDVSRYEDCSFSTAVSILIKRGFENF